MSLLEKLKAKITSTNKTIQQPDLDSGTNVTITDEEKQAAQEGRYQIPVAVDEYFPWKGHIFKVTQVGKLNFSAQCTGLTRNRAEKLGMR